jgi:hypothetical protein
MNSVNSRVLVVIGLLMLAACLNNDKIFGRLRGKYKDDVIRGATEAGRTKDTIFVPELLKNADDPRVSTNIDFYGVSVYQAKMEALEEIFQKSPPNKITYRPDSRVIKFYSELAKLAYQSK